MYKKARCTCRVVVLVIKPIVFLTFPLPSSSWFRKVPIVKSRTRPAGRIGDFRNFLIVFTKNPYLLPYIWHRSIFFWLNTRRVLLNSLHENVLWCDQFNNLLCKGSACFDRPGLKKKKKKQRLIALFTSNVMYIYLEAWFTRHQICHQDLLVLKVNLSNTKLPAWFLILASLLDRGMQRVNFWLPLRTILCWIKVYFGAV